MPTPDPDQQLERPAADNDAADAPATVPTRRRPTAPFFVLFTALSTAIHKVRCHPQTRLTIHTFRNKHLTAAASTAALEIDSHRHHLANRTRLA
jgi:hypothetical protein